MITIYRKCRWSGGRERKCCFAPWETEDLDLVTGKVTRIGCGCADKNDGDCEHFEYRFVRRCWNHFLNALLKALRTPTRNNYAP